MKKLAVLLTTLVMIVTLAGCGNMQAFDTTFTFDKAIISFPDGTVLTGKVQSWRDYEDGDQIQVKIDGKTYLVHSANIVLIAE